MLLRKILLGLLFGSAIGSAHAQTPSPANVGIVRGTPNAFKVLDSSNTWSTFGFVDPVTHVFTPAGGGGGGGTPSFPQTVIGGVSGGIPYFSTTTTLSASPLLTLNALMLGGGVGNPPKTTATGTGVVTAVGNPINAANGLAVINGSITTNDCLKWGPGITDAGACGSGGGGGSLTVTDGTNSVSGTTSLTFTGATVSGSTPNATATITAGGAGQTNFATHAALISATTTFSTNTLMQTNYSTGISGGAAFYDWNSASYCPGGTSGSPTAAEGNLCIKPSGQAAGTAGRYILRLTNGAIDARQMGFKDDGSDNASAITALNVVLPEMLHPMIVFTANGQSPQSNYWSTQPFFFGANVAVQCGLGTRVFFFPQVNLIVTPGVSGVQFNNVPTTTALNGCGVLTNSLTENFTPTSGSPIIPATGFGIPFDAEFGANFGTNPVYAVGDSPCNVCGCRLLGFCWEYYRQYSYCH